MTVRVFTFWTGPQSPVIRLCLQSIAQNAPGSECWTLEQFHAAYDGSLGPWPRIARQKPNVISDILRAWLLTTYGGIWLDADCVLFRDLRPLWSHIDSGADLVTYRVPSSKVCTALMAAPPGSPIIAEQCRRITRILARHRRVPSMALGPRCFRRAIMACPKSRVHYVPFRLMHPAPIWGWSHHRLALQSATAYPFHPDAYAFMLTHKAVRTCAGDDPSRILESPLPIGQALRKALDKRRENGDVTPIQQPDGG